MDKTELKMFKPIHFSMPILGISKTFTYEFYYSYMKPKYDKNAKLSYMSTDSFVFHIETENFYKNIKSDVKNEFDKSNYKPLHQIIDHYL